MEAAGGCWLSCLRPEALPVLLFLMVLLPLPQIVHDVSLHNGDVGAMVPAHDGHALRAHQELLKVPLDVMVPQRLPEELVGVPKLLRHWWTGILQWGASISLPCPSKKKAGCVHLISPCHSTHLQKGEDLLLLGPIHIPFLKQLEVGNKAISWPDIPTRRGKQDDVQWTAPGACTAVVTGPQAPFVATTASSSRSLCSPCLAGTPAEAEE